MNISDMIAATIQSLLDQQGGTTQIQRNELAETLGCVPSQINYVITSRFTPEQGYIIESKRGGGGYIRIMRVRNSQKNTIMHLINSIGDELDEGSARVILKNLSYDNFINDREVKMILSAISERTFQGIVPAQARATVRSKLFKTMLLNTIED